MKQTKRYVTAAVIFLILLLMIMSGGQTAFAATAYSDIIEDLRRDPKFNYDDYPSDTRDYSLNVIQIAESTDGELLIYVYQPAADKTIRASEINIAREMDHSTGLGFKPYKLEYLTSTGVFFKYRVLDLEIRPDAVRYYNISNILRPYRSDIDEPPAEGQAITSVPNRVAQFWTACTVGGEVTYSMTFSDVIEITEKVVGYCIYDDGMDLGWGAMQGATKAYFVAFDTDRPIDKLISADLSFFATRVKCKYCGNPAHSHGTFYDFEPGEYIDFGTGVHNNEPLTITDKQSFGNVGGGNIRPAKKFLRKRIRSTSDFLSDEINEDYTITNHRNALDKTKWVLNFYECQDKCKLNNVWLSYIPGINLIEGVADGEAELNDVYDVEILRLEFETDGKTYNLGVVDNRQTGNTQFNEPIRKGGCNCEWIKILPWWAWLLIIIFAPLAIFLALKLIIWIIKLPFKLIKRGVTKRREKKAKQKRKDKTSTTKKKGGKK